MKRINTEWWRSDEGFYKEIAPGKYEGPYADMDQQPVTGDDSTVIDSGEIEVYPVDKQPK